MEPIVGIFRSRSVAETAARTLKAHGFDAERVGLPLPEGVPTEEAEQSGVGPALGGVVGAAAGASAGLGIGAGAASFLVPGVGAITAMGLAGAALFGTAGALGGAAAGEALEEDTRRGIPRDELFLYEDALAQGKGIVFVFPNSDNEASSAETALAQAGAETLDAAREAWWIGIRDVERARYDASEQDFDAAERVYRKGLMAALRPDARGKTFDQERPVLRERFGDLVDDQAFRQGFTRGSAMARERSEQLEPAMASEERG